MIQIKIIFLSFFFSCLLSERCVLGISELRDRPELDAFYLSDSGHFKIHYDLTDDNGNLPIQEDNNNNNITDYIESVAEIAEQSRDVLINDMGYLAEPDDGDGVYDIYVKNQSSWGYNYSESQITGASYITIDNDYLGSAFDSDYCASQIDKMKISVAHEFFHAIQRSYRPNSATDHDFLLEMSSMWFEDLMVENCNDYLSFVDALSYSIFRNPSQQFDGSDLETNQSSAYFGYSMALFGHYLSRIVDQTGIEDEKESNIIRHIWEEYENQNNEDDLNAAGRSIINVIENNYQNSFSNIWTDFISRNIFSGRFGYFNEDFYYYSDQQYLDPITIDISHNYIYPNQTYDVSELSQPYSATIISLFSMSNQLLNVSMNNQSQNFNSYILQLGSNYLLSSFEASFSTVFNNSDRIYVISTPISGEIEELDISVYSEYIPETQISIYPNPLNAYNYLSIDINTYQYTDNLLIAIYNIIGEKIMEKRLDNIVNGKNPISIDDIPSSGIYFIDIHYNKKNYNYKITYIK